MPILTSRYWYGVCGMTQEEVREDVEGIQTMRFLDRNMVWMLNSLEAARNAGIVLPEQEEVTFIALMQFVL